MIMMSILIEAEQRTKTLELYDASIRVRSNTTTTILSYLTYTSYPKISFHVMKLLTGYQWYRKSEANISKLWCDQYV